jgi:chromosome segregation ATPase
LEAEKTALQQQLQEPPRSLSKSPSPGRKDSAASPAPDSDKDVAPIVARLRLDLVEALRARGQFEARLQAAEDELVKLRAKTAADSKSIRELTTERRTLAIKLRDKEEELRAKTVLMADTQDELAVLNMQLDQVEKRAAKTEAENKQLVERFKKRIGQEVDAMNLANEQPVFPKKR